MVKLIELSWWYYTVVLPVRVWGNFYFVRVRDQDERLLAAGGWRLADPKILIHFFIFFPSRPQCQVRSAMTKPDNPSSELRACCFPTRTVKSPDSFSPSSATAPGTALYRSLPGPLPVPRPYRTCRPHPHTYCPPPHT